MRLSTTTTTMMAIMMREPHQTNGSKKTSIELPFDLPSGDNYMVTWNGNNKQGGILPSCIMYFKTHETVLSQSPSS